MTLGWTLYDIENNSFIFSKIFPTYEEARDSIENDIFSDDSVANIFVVEVGL